MRSLADRARRPDNLALLQELQEIWEFADMLHNAGWWIVDPWPRNGSVSAMGRLLAFATKPVTRAWLHDELLAYGRSDLAEAVGPAA